MLAFAGQLPPIHAGWGRGRTDESSRSRTVCGLTVLGAGLMPSDHIIKHLEKLEADHSAMGDRSFTSSLSFRNVQGSSSQQMIAAWINCLKAPPSLFHDVKNEAAREQMLSELMWQARPGSQPAELDHWVDVLSADDQGIPYLLLEQPVRIGCCDDDQTAAEGHDHFVLDPIGDTTRALPRPSAHSKEYETEVVKQWTESCTTFLDPLFSPMLPPELLVVTIAGDVYPVCLRKLQRGNDLRAIVSEQHPELGPEDSFVLSAETADGTLHTLRGDGGPLLHSGAIDETSVMLSWLEDGEAAPVLETSDKVAGAALSKLAAEIICVAPAESGSKGGKADEGKTICRRWCFRGIELLLHETTDSRLEDDGESDAGDYGAAGRAPPPGPDKVQVDDFKFVLRWRSVPRSLGAGGRSRAPRKTDVANGQALLEANASSILDSWDASVTSDVAAETSAMRQLLDASGLASTVPLVQFADFVFRLTTLHHANLNNEHRYDDQAASAEQLYDDRRKAAAQAIFKARRDLKARDPALAAQAHPMRSRFGMLWLAACLDVFSDADCSRSFAVDPAAEAIADAEVASGATAGGAATEAAVCTRTEPAAQHTSSTRKQRGTATCTNCKSKLPKADFSRAQLRKPACQLRCKGCVCYSALAETGE